MHCGVTRPHSHSVHHSWCRICLEGGRRGGSACVPAAHSSCAHVCVCVCVIKLFASAPRPRVCCRTRRYFPSVNLSKSPGRRVSARKLFTYVCERCMSARARPCFFHANAVRLPIWRCYAALLSQLSNGFNKLVVCCSVHARTHTKLHTRHGPEYAHILTHG